MTSLLASIPNIPKSQLCLPFLHRTSLQQFSFTYAASPSTLIQDAIGYDEKEQVGQRRTTELKFARLSRF